MSDTDVCTQLVTVDEEELDFLRKISADYDVELQEARSSGIDIVTTMVVLLVGATTAVATLNHLLESRRGGQVIDVRPGAAKTVYRDKDVTYGLVIIITQDGVVRVEIHEPKGLFGSSSEILIGMIGTLAGSSTEDAGNIVRERLSDVASISTSDAPLKNADPR